MAQLNIKQIRGASQGSVLFLGTNSVVSEDYNKLHWDNSSDTFYVGGNLQLVDGNQQSGYILVSDSSGLATWQQQTFASQSVVEIPISGTQNGTNRNFVLSAGLTSPTNLFFINGQLVVETIDYIVSGTALSIDNDRPAPTASDSLRIFGVVSSFDLVGSSGTSGTSGTSGSSGTSGTTGTSGTSGTSGTTGTSGTSGTSAIDGTSGTSGTSATSGTSGTSGTSATSGTSGTSAIDGTSGTSATSGTSGTSAIDGTSGTSGTSATSGTSGTSATSGTSGTGFDTISNPSNNRILTSDGTTNAANAESNLTFDGSTLSLVGDLVVDGDLTINGTTSTINTINLTVEDSLILLAATQTGSPSLDAGFMVNRGTGATQAFIWDESADEFAVISTNDSAITQGNLTISTYSNLRANQLQSERIKLTEGAQDNYILMSDSQGLAFWTASVPGTSGTSGTSATSGTSGTSGTSATSGTSGTSATSGTSGTSATSGTSGTSGTSATSGTSGTSGTSATSGTSGTGFDTISNPVDNRLLTSDGTSNAATAESNLTFDGSILNLSGSVIVSDRIEQGLNTDASVSYSVAFGELTQADGFASIAEGYQTNTVGTYSHASGRGTVAYKEGQFVVGDYNLDLNSTDLFVIGNGQDGSNRSDLANFGTGSITFNSTLQVNSLDFASVSVVSQEKRMYWDNKNRTVALGLAGGNVNLQLGQEQFYLVTNQTGATLSNGKVVGAVGVSASGDAISAGLFLADGSVSSEYILGVVTEDIINGDKGFVTQFGLVRGIDTTGSEYGETWSEGDILYASGTIGGGLTKFKPTSPEIAITMANVISATSSGSLFIRPTFYGRIQDLDNVEFYGVTPSSEATLNYSSTASVWTWREFSYGSYNAGIISGATAWSQSGNGTITLPTVQVALYDNANFISPLKLYTVNGTVSGTGTTPDLVNEDTNYIFIDYNGGNPIWNLDQTENAINGSSIVRYMTVYRAGNFIHNLEFGNYGSGLAEKLNARIIGTERFARESGLTIGLSGSTGILTLSEGIAWNGSFRQELASVNSADDFLFKNYHVSGNWTYSVSTPFTYATASDLINNEYYDNGTDRVVASASKYLVNWYYRGQEINDHLYEVLGNDQYDTFGEAEFSAEPAIPELVQSHAILVGRVIVQVGTYSGTAQTAFGTVFQSSSTTAHNDLSAIQGGVAGEYYHLSQTQFDNLALINVDNNFSTNQTINGYQLKTEDWANGEILISTTNSVVGSGFTFSDLDISSSTIWSSQKVYDYSNRETIDGNKTFSGDILIQGTLSVLDSFTAGTEFIVNTNSKFRGDILPIDTDTYRLGSPTFQWDGLYVASQSVYVGGVTISSNNDAIAIHKLNLGTETNPTLLTASGSEIYINGTIFSAGDTKTLIVAKDGSEYTSIKTAVESITDATASNVYTVKVRSGVYYEEPFTIPSYVAIVGESSISTIIEATFSNQTLITLSDQSAVFDVQIQGCTDTGVSAVVYSSTTTPQTNAIAYVENVRFGSNYTHAKVIGTASGNCIMQCSNVKYGGYPFTIGFQATNAGSGIGRMQLRNVTSTNGGITTTTGLIFAKADATGCGFIVNGCLLTKSVGTAAGIGFQVENGGFLRLTGVNFQRWSKGIYAPEDSGSPSIDAIALNFENNTTDVQIDNTKTTGKISGTDNYTKTIVSPTASLYIVGKDTKRIIVAKKGGDFSTIGQAVDAITDSSETNRYTIEVGPGIFRENLIDLSTKPYVSIVGANIQTTQVVASQSNHDLFKMGLANEISFLSIGEVGTPGSGYAGILADDSGDFSQAHKLSFYNCDIGIKVLSQTQETLFFGEYIDFNGTFSQAVCVDSQDSGFRSFANLENFYVFSGVTGSMAVCVYNENAEVNVSVATFEGLGNDTAIYLEDGAKVDVSSTDIKGYETGLWVPNIGTSSIFNLSSVTINDDVVNSLTIEQPNTRGFFQGSLYDHTTITTNSEDIYWSFIDRIDGELNITRKASVTFADGNTTDLTTLVFETGPMGVISGGIISISSGLTVSVSSGYGYLETTTDSHKRVDWSTSFLQLPDNSSQYIYINQNDILTNSSTLPSTENNIVLGRVVTYNNGVLFIDNTRVDVKHADNKLNLFNRRAIGAIYESGSIVTQAVGSYSIDVTSGSYWFGESNFTPSGGATVSFEQLYRDGLGGWIISSTNSITSDYDNNSGSLITMSASYFTKHTLYVVGEGVDEKYLLVVGQTQYLNLVDAEDDSLPTPPTYFEDGVAAIASIYVQQGGSSILQIEDIRPVLGFKSSGVNATSDHGNLLGLSDDDHQQYLLGDGSRAMTGNLQMGSNSITGVLQVNGVTVQSHASRHLPNGSDPIATGVPSTIGTSNTEGTANAFARQDHVHDHGNQLGGSLHSVASTTEAGFMSAADKTTFDAIPATYVNATGDNITGFLGVTGSLSFTFSSMRITDTGTGEGLLYTSDYSSTFATNSAVSRKYVDDRLRKTATVITTTGSTVTSATLSVPQGNITVFEIYASATSSNTIWGAWKREVVVSNFSGTANVEFLNSQLDKQSGLLPSSLSFTCSTSNLLVQVTGTSSGTVNWITKYETII